MESIMSTTETTDTPNVSPSDAGPTDAGAPAPTIPETPAPGDPSASAPGAFRIERSATGEIFFVRDGKSTGARLCSCFPWSESRRYISLRDYEANELALIEDLGDLDQESRAAVEMALGETDFVFEVEEVLSLVTEFEIRNWRVRTRQGETQFQTELDDWPRPLAGGGLLFRDVVGNLFLIPDPKRLDERSQKLLWAYID
jgi:hypothetical protein